MFHRSLCYATLLLVLSTLATRPARAQQHRLLPPGDPVYTLIQRLQQRGHLLELNPTALPYTQGDVVRTLDQLDRATLSDRATRWTEQLEAHLSTPSPESPAHIGGQFEAGVRATNNGRLDPLRALNNDLPPLLPRAALHGYLEAGSFIGHLGLQHDLYYDVDPDGLDAVRRLYTRNEQSYAGYDGPFASAYLGRFAQHWGVPEAPGLVVSANPRAYDQLTFRLGAGSLTLRSLLGELDPISENGVFTGRGFEDGSRARWLAAHRIDWRPSHHLTLSLIESILYSGPRAGPSLKYLNPLQTLYFVVANTPRHHQTNGLVAGLLWAQHQQWTLQGQLLVDDFDFLNAEEPASFGLTGSLRRAALAPGLDFEAGLTMVASRTFNTDQNEGKYLYLKRGLGTEFNDYVHAYLEATLFLGDVLRGLTVSPQMHWLGQGERSIMDDYALIRSEAALILDGTVAHTIRPALDVRFQPTPTWWIQANLGINVLRNENHQPDQNALRFIGLLEMGGRFSLSRALSLSD